MEPAVVAEDVRKRYGETVALDGVTLSVDSGEVFGLIGPNGAGKTTLVRALTGTIDPDDGSITVLDDEPTTVDPHRIAVLPQAFSPPARLTAAELVTYYAGLYANARDPESVLSAVGLAEAADTRFEHLSGGQQRRLCVASALVNDPEVVFLDEPTTGIDPAGRRTIWRLVEALAEAGTTVVLTTHDMAEAAHLADRVGLLADGDLVAIGTPAELVADHGGQARLSVGIDAEERPASAVLDAFEHDVEVQADRLVVRGVDAREVGTIAEGLDEAGVAYHSLSWTEPGLEEVYLELTDTANGSGAGEFSATGATYAETQELSDPSTAESVDGTSVDGSPTGGHR